MWVDSQVIKYFDVWQLFCDTEVKSKNMLARQACCTVQVVYYFLDVLLPSQTDFNGSFDPTLNGFYSYDSNLLGLSYDSLM